MSPLAFLASFSFGQSLIGVANWLISWDAFATLIDAGKIVIGLGCVVFGLALLAWLCLPSRHPISWAELLDGYRHDRPRPLPDDPGVGGDERVPCFDERGALIGFAPHALIERTLK